MFRFRLRTLLIATAILAVLLGWVAHTRHHAYQRTDVLNRLCFLALPGSVSQPTWHRWLFGDDPYYAAETCIVVLDPTHEDAKLLAELPNLRHLTLYRITDTGLARLSELLKLEELELEEAAVTGTGLRDFDQMPRLRELHLCGTQVGDAGLSHVGRLRHLEVLDLSETPLTDAGLAQLANLTELKELRLFSTFVTDAGLWHLKSLTKLRSLYLHNTQVTTQGVEELRQSLPSLVNVQR